MSTQLSSGYCDHSGRRQYCDDEDDDFRRRRYDEDDDSRDRRTIGYRRLA
jgi:hypothetical protein